MLYSITWHIFVGSLAGVTIAVGFSHSHGVRRYFNTCDSSTWHVCVGSLAGLPIVGFTITTMSGHAADEDFPDFHHLDEQSIIHFI